MTPIPHTVEVAMPTPFRGTFTYSVPAELRNEVAFGIRVVAPFRKRRLTGIVVAVNAEPDGHRDFEIKPLAEILPGGAILSAELFELCQWVAEYYFAPIGEVLRAACPPAFAASVRQRVRLTAKGQRHLEAEDERRSPNHLFESDAEELELLRLVASKDEVEWRALSRTHGKGSGRAAFKSLLRREEIRMVGFNSRRRIEEKQETWVRISPDFEALISKRRFSAGQQRILDHLMEKKSALLLSDLVRSLNVNASTVRGLAKKNLVILEQVARQRVPLELSSVSSLAPMEDNLLELTAEQRRALGVVEEQLHTGRFAVSLLFGVTASGKTEVYMRAIEKALSLGGTALMLVPEISLTPATARNFAARFSGQVAIWHSGLSEGERYDEWWRIKQGEARVVIGTRSAVFAPLDQLRLIIVDEEHEGSYKQQESPRYQGRDVAVMRAKMADAVVVLGSATPAMESFYNAERGKYQLVTLKTRVESRPLAKVSIVDMRKEFKETKKNALLSRELVTAIESRLSADEQVLVLLNRRGFSSYVLCRACGSARQCPHCSITMTYHKRRQILMCHYCSTATPVPKTCWQCGSEHLYFIGFGTEQIEEKLKSEFPLARIARLDRDTVQGRSSYQRILGEFSQGLTNILVGTQMIAKGHDFPRVTLVGVLNADGALGFPDFRAGERTFQLLTQVAGRSGRGATPGEVILQAFYPEHYAIRCAAQQDFNEFYAKEIHFRRMMHYPPFAQLALVGIRHRDFDEAMKLAKALGNHLRQNVEPEVRVLGPAIAPLARLKQEYRWQLLLKSSRRSPLKRMLERGLKFCEERKISEPNILIDLDPTNMM